MQGNLRAQQRVRALQALLTREEVTVITTFDGLIDRLRPLEKVGGSPFCVSSQDSIVQIDALAEKLSRLGYEREIQVEAPRPVRRPRWHRGRLCPDERTPPGGSGPWDDEVWNSIRSFDVESQRSVWKIWKKIVDLSGGGTSTR